MKLACVPNRLAVYVAIPAKVERPVMFNCCAVRFVALVTPRVVIPLELIFVRVALVLVKVLTVPTPELI